MQCASCNNRNSFAPLALVMGAVFFLFMAAGIYWLYQEQTAKYRRLAQQTDPVNFKARFDVWRGRTTLVGSYRGHTFRYANDDTHPMTHRVTLVMDAPVSVDGTANAQSLAPKANDIAVRLLLSIHGFRMIELRSRAGKVEEAANFEPSSIARWRQELQRPLFKISQPGLLIFATSEFAFDTRLLKRMLDAAALIAESPAVQTALIIPGSSTASIPSQDDSSTEPPLVPFAVPSRR